MRRKRILLWASLFLFLSACQTITKHPSRESRKETAPPSAPSTTPSEPPVKEAPESEETEEPAPETPTVPVAAQKPRLAIILGPGGLRAFAHAGFVQEISKAKIPVFWIGGMEMGALPAALYALKAQPFEAEWQMMKLKEEDVLHKGLLSGASPAKADTLAEPLKLMFGGVKVEDAKIPSMCSSYSIEKRQTFLMNRGPFSQMLLYCLPLLPLFEPYQGSGANPMALAQLASAAKQKGAQLLVYVDLLADSPVSENEGGFVWGLFQQAIESQLRSVNEIVKVPGLPGLRAFDKRREMILKGQEAGRRLVQVLQTKYGF
jgi:NTE family protein